MRRLALAVLALAAVALTATPASSARPQPQVIAHHADGSAARVAKLPTVQLIRTNHLALEPTMGFDRRGRAYANGAHLDSTTGLFVPSLVRVDTGGRTVEDVTPHKGEATAHQSTQDPYVYVDPATGRVFHVDLTQAQCSQISYSDDGGGAWEDSVSGCTLMDHQTLFAGPAPKGTAQPIGYPNVVYYCAVTLGSLARSSYGVGCERSLDGGATWVNTGGFAYTFDPIACQAGAYTSQASCDGITGQGAVSPDGTVLIPKGFARQPWLALSSDEGLTWRRVQVANNGIREDPYEYGDGQTSVATDKAGTIYYGWTARDRQSYLAYSRDGGTTWSRPVRATRPGVRQVWHTAIDVLGPGRVAVHYLGTENGPGAPFPDDGGCRFMDPVEEAQHGLLASCPDGIAAYARTSWNGYLTVSRNLFAKEPTFLSARLNPANDPLTVGECGVLRCQQQYDFTDTHINPVDGAPWAVYADGCSGPISSACKKDGTLQLARLVGIDLR